MAPRAAVSALILVSVCNLPPCTGGETDTGTGTERDRQTEGVPSSVTPHSCSTGLPSVTGVSIANASEVTNTHTHTHTHIHSLAHSLSRSLTHRLTHSVCVCISRLYADAALSNLNLHRNLWRLAEQFLCCGCSDMGDNWQRDKVARYHLQARHTEGQRGARTDTRNDRERQRDREGGCSAGR